MLKKKQQKIKKKKVLKKEIAATELEVIRKRKFDKLLTLQRQNDIITLLLEGKQPKEIAQYIVTKYRLTYGTSLNYVSEGQQTIKQRKLHEVPVMVPLHIKRYDEIYERLYDMKAFGVSMKALKAKEKLLNFHKESFNMKIVSGQLVQTSIQNIPAMYDTLKLDKDKRKRISELMDKIRK